MGDTGVQAAGEQLLAQAVALRAAYPDAAALRGLPIRTLPDGTDWPALRAALRCLRAEMELVRDGRAGGVGVLDDEIASAERELAMR